MGGRDGRVSPPAVFETPEHSLLQHRVTAQLGEPVRAETVADGRLQRWCWVRGDVSVVPARMPNKENWAGTTEYVAVRLSPALLARSVDDPTGTEVELAPGFGMRDPLVEHIVLDLLAEVRASGTAACVYGQAMTTALCAYLLKKHGFSKRRPKEVAGALSRRELRWAAEHVEENLASDLSLAELAGVAEMSPHHFSRLFKQSTGLSPHQYVVRRRLERAKRLLRYEALSLFEVARASGFTDLAHLTRHFKRAAGATPGEFRR